MIGIQAVPASIPVRTVLAIAHDDLSAHGLQDYLNAGFREVEWRYGFEPWQNTKLWREMGSVCPVCFALDGQRFKIKWLLDNMRHNAPKYSMSHVNCACELFRVDRAQELLDYGEEMTVAPSTIEEDLKVQPFDLEQVPQDARDNMGLPKQVNEWTDVKWVWDGDRGEFVPIKAMEERETPLWLWDAEGNEFVTHEEWTKRHGFR